MSDLISREVLKGIWELYKLYQPRLATNVYKFGEALKDIIDNAQTVEPFERIGSICEENCGYRPQGELAEKLKDRIEESVCKYCQMNKHCELCEISRVFLIIALTNEEMKGGADNG